ncbi:bifunctional 2-polyprenyl-6-hydroxyphenol methylase/3-demethylubiquinol 3-O-methyltransferase UbiG [Rhizorhabdus dicambivorans]|uniref:Ubiquinone biosynthesis O-methyltransferase n=1 Tax=Rhizorhabdus dicambivorans TaxID=1850238 RepID=A0A2A4FWG3_9SPHN|nr:bifunctional 2-polyprenyl-6-hydroxyphenol methylase/3-demethylubiquinol 3-O-methyltransferase UbiG [Rhizorhabdus dicambivorans]ATE66013.1 bifunctional 2-polyprenyl-6-hydroxyphenol methylase/3-demethylubiquinol 3-O-methyltransferase UbiG [Rhizorhabdus dicambivorans]PCE43131.1 bifunctional 2-polyprenyl-6-hydroxyphenol methylase/3-demethylubiquinol 3-O-methyltransferase UbiG [Rhizorhabdus dicambivorans]
MNASAQKNGSVVAEEAAHFGRLAAEWWDPKGSSAMLHKLNPPRLRHIRATIDAHWGTDPESLKPLAGRRAVDVGCGAGLLAEPLARMGAAVTGIDAAPENIAVARLHAEKQGLSIGYRAGGAEALTGETFDLVTSMEVIEHVADPASFVTTLARLLAPGGIMILSTPNRTPLSKLAMITLGEGLGMVPKGTHDWQKFLTPDELAGHIEAAGLRVIERKGLSFSPAVGFHLSDNMALDYFLTAIR